MNAPLQNGLFSQHRQPDLTNQQPTAYQNHNYPTQGLPQEAFALSHSGVRNGSNGNHPAKDERCMTDVVAQALLLDSGDAVLRKNSLNARSRSDLRPDEDRALRFSQATFVPEPGLVPSYDG